MRRWHVDKKGQSKVNRKIAFWGRWLIEMKLIFWLGRDGTYLGKWSAKLVR